MCQQTRKNDLPLFPRKISRKSWRRNSKNTKKATDYAINAFKAYLNQKGLSADVSSYSAPELGSALSKFYAEARTKTGELYKKSSLVAIRHGLNRTVSGDIIGGEEFTNSRKMFSAVVVDLKRQGKGGIDHHPPLERADLEKLYTSFVVSVPESLQEKVFVDILLYFGRRGRVNLQELKVSDFSYKRDTDGHFYIYLDRDELTKNHKDDSNTADGRMYEIPDADERCPVKTFVKYERLLPPGSEILFPRSRKIPNKHGLYFNNAPIGHNKLGRMMTDLSEKYSLSKKYTNHSLRATSMHILDSAQFPSRHIMTVTGHKAETSLKTYTGYTNKATKKHMSNTISESTGLTKKPKVSIASATASFDASNLENIPTPSLNLEDCTLTPLSDSQVVNFVSELEYDDMIDKLLCEIAMPHDPPMRQQTHTYNNLMYRYRLSMPTM